MVPLTESARGPASLAVAAAAGSLARSLQVSIRRPGDLPRPVIYAFLHGHQLALLRFPRPRQTAALVSRSRDGALQSRILEHLGFAVLRGSSTTGGAAALASCLAWLEGGGDLALAVDGPRGPAGRAKPGVVFLAQKARVPILPVACGIARTRRLERTWDRFLVPMPFSRVHIVAGAPFRPWEKDWTEKRKLAYLDSLIEALTERAGRDAVH